MPILIKCGNFELRNIILVNRVTSMIEKFKLISENMTQMSFIAIYILFGYYPFTTEATTVGVTVVASLKLCTMQYKNIIDTLISTIIVLNFVLSSTIMTFLHRFLGQLRVHRLDYHFVQETRIFHGFLLYLFHLIQLNWKYHFQFQKITYMYIVRHDISSI